MAGPCAVVLLPDAWTAADTQEFRAWLAKSFGPDGGIDSWVLLDPHHLGLSAQLRAGPLLIEPGPYVEDDADETACLTQAAGFPPRSEIILAAAVNGKDDHRLLAELAVAIVGRYGGLISLDGPLPTPAPQSSGGRPTQLEQSRAAITTLRGRWHEIPYRTAAGEAATYHVVDAELLTSWLRHPHFRMVK